ncbi:homocysteine-responsive endoplasmic reticulum-resident ubiquitin-like domain member 2 protein [Caerostris extrusa]|uniref:Homocysteine-responsive endoplasmic reticulum-resident ubiquitin-like domain member 2 protein n=1 Tax=Caerostris extrusa TaxID=172846 RepID=A0AAV4SE95_CAEEX|nr:homocysteine-responsive endoplasmic reticulum-resident ubiquitin-like domain member 2 protein [Caerostris extrusa]
MQEIKLTIKSALQNVEDFSLLCEMTWTIAQVKDQLSTSYPTKPKREHQRLIYGGRLLPDHLTLKSVINPTQDIHIIHLVISSPLESDIQKPTQSVPQVYTASPPPNPDGMYPQMNDQVINSGINSLPASSWSPTYNTSDPTQQYMVMQQMYMQMMSQYLAQFNGNVPYGPLLANSPVQPPTVNTSRPNVPQNAPARPAAEDERDFIDYLFIFSRMAMLFSILLYYSSPIRVIGVIFMLSLIKILVKAMHKHRQERQRANETQNDTNEQAPVEEQVSENEQVPETSASTESATTEVPNTNQPVTSVPSTILTLITSFFSSLIPLEAIPVNAN